MRMRRDRVVWFVVGWSSLVGCSCLATSEAKEASGAAPSRPAASAPTPGGPAPSGVAAAAFTTASNPFAGAELYVNPDFAQTVAAVAATAGPDAAALRKLATFPTAVWLDSIARVPSIARHLAEAKRQQADKRAAAVVPLFVVYDLPLRDCAAKASNGELGAQDGDRYEREFIDAIAEQFRARPQQRVAVVLEPDSLANLATNLSLPRCAAAAPLYQQGIAYAVAKLSLPNVAIYLDAAHGGWLGWGHNRQKIVQIWRTVLDAAGGPDRIRGFAVNVSNYNPVQVVGGRRGNPDEPGPDEATYVADLRRSLAAVGIRDKGFIIDTSRNGKGGIRSSSANWCNVRDAGLGLRPRVEPLPGVDAFLWIKIPGESDGTADPGAARFDGNCASADAAPGAPEAGQLFVPYLRDLVKNAVPPLAL